MPSDLTILKDLVLDRQLLEEGYVIMPFLDEAGINSLKELFYAHHPKTPEGLYATAHSQDTDFRKKMNDGIRTVMFPKVKAAFDSCRPLGGSFITKAPGEKGLLQPHQDWNIVDENEYRSFNIWLPLVDVDEKNGCIYILEKSHALLPTLRGPNLPPVYGPATMKMWEYMVPLKMKAGEALIYDHRLIHASAVNETGELRLAAVFGIIPGEAPMRYYYVNDAGKVEVFDLTLDFFFNENIALGPNGLKSLGFVDYDFPEVDSDRLEALISGESHPSSPLEHGFGLSLESLSALFGIHPEIYQTANGIPVIDFKPMPEAGEKNQVISAKMVVDQPLSGHSADVGKFYDETNDKFLQVYGEVIQAYRTKDVSILLDHQIEAMELKPGQRVLDAGCGVCGPATYLAKKAGVIVEGVTASGVQVEKAWEIIRREGLEGKVSVCKGDYHKLTEIFEPESFDVVYFLESFGHSDDKSAALQSAWDVLKPGGLLYIKDLFQKIAPLPEQEEGLLKEVNKINKAYRYRIADLNEVLHTIRKMGFILSSLKTIDFRIEDFENLTISNDFQELTGIARIDSWDDYIFPVDFFELKCFKPVWDLSKGAGRYFLQNFLHMKVYNKTRDEL